MDFVDNQLNPQTGTIRARAVLDNSRRVFTPGLFARIQLLGSAATDTLLIDDKAILTDQDRKYVYVLNEQNQAIRRDVKPGRLVDGMRVITSGLEAGEVIIVHGIQKIFYPGMVVVPMPIAMGDMPANSVPAVASLEPSQRGIGVGLDSDAAE
jgi:multidrug efflux system membrane fusion protein